MDREMQKKDVDRQVNHEDPFCLIVDSPFPDRTSHGWVLMLTAQRISCARFLTQEGHQANVERFDEPVDTEDDRMTASEMHRLPNGVDGVDARGASRRCRGGARKPCLDNSVSRRGRGRAHAGAWDLG